MSQQSEHRTRREAVQRVQIGLAGFGAVLLIVMLANLIVSSARPDSAQNDAGVAVPATAAAVGAPNNVVAPPLPAIPDSEPLADLGVTPKSDAQANPVTPAVPDLEPDPRLARPMDQDPKRAQRPAAQQ